jgi:hypothetical protein
MKRFVFSAFMLGLMALPAYAIQAPGAVAAKPLSQTQIEVTWRDRSTTEDRFEIYRSQGGGVFVRIGSVPANSIKFTDSGLAASTTYSYRVDAIDAAESAVASATTLADVITPPPPPPPPGGYPDASTTGVAAGVVLKRVPEDATSGLGWYWDSRGWVAIDGAGTTFSGYIVPAGIEVSADNVVIENVRIIAATDYWGIGVRHAKNTIIRNCEIGGTGTNSRMMVAVKTIYGDEQNTTVKGCNIAFTGTGIQLYWGLVEDNYIHDMAYKTGEHVNGFTSNSSIGPLVIRHNRIENQVGQTDAIGLFEDFGVQKDVTVDNNFLAGGGYTLYAGQNTGGPATSNIVVTNNRFSRKFFPNGGSYGPYTAWCATCSGNVWSGNVWDDTGAPLN